MKKVFLITVLILSSLTGVVLAQSVNVSNQARMLTCNSKSTIKQCQDKVSIDSLSIQLLAAQANVFAIQSQIQNYVADYLSEKSNADLVLDNATVTQLQSAQAANMAVLNSQLSQVNGT